MKSFAKFIGRLPFSGKMSIKPLVFGLYQSTTWEERQWNYAKLAGFLVLFILIHGVQMTIGIRALEFESPVWAKVVSAFYAIANFFAVLTQVYLGYRTTRFFFRDLYPRVKRSYTEHSGTEVAIMHIVTLGGQIIFFSQYLWYG